MSVKINIPTPLKKLVENQSTISADGENILEVINDMDRQYPGIKERICDEQDKVRRFVNIYLNGEDIRFMDAEQSKVAPDDEISIIPAIAGG